MTAQNAVDALQRFTSRMCLHILTCNLLSICDFDKIYTAWKLRRRPFYWWKQNANPPNILGDAIETIRRHFGPIAMVFPKNKTSGTIIKVTKFNILILVKHLSQLHKWRCSKRSRILRHLSSLVTANASRRVMRCWRRRATSSILCSISLCASPALLVAAFVVLVPEGIFFLDPLEDADARFPSAASLICVAFGTVVFRLDEDFAALRLQT